LGGRKKLEFSEGEWVILNETTLADGQRGGSLQSAGMMEAPGTEGGESTRSSEGLPP